jgi:hypothetical protein
MAYREARGIYRLARDGEVENAIQAALRGVAWKDGLKSNHEIDLLFYYLRKKRRKDNKGDGVLVFSHLGYQFFHT